MHVLVLGGGEHFNGNMYQAEADGAFPDSMNGGVSFALFLSIGSPLGIKINRAGNIGKE
jgi:hypothetical protein